MNGPAAVPGPSSFEARKSALLRMTGMVSNLPHRHQTYHGSSASLEACLTLPLASLKPLMQSIA